MKASIVIPTKDKCARLALVVKALETQVNENVEVIIVFDGCVPSTLQEFEKIHFTFKPRRVILKKNQGRAVARNKGIQVAKGEIIIFVDDDRIPEKDFVEQHINAHENGGQVVLGRRLDVDLQEDYIDNLLNSDEFNTLFETTDFLKSLASQSVIDEFMGLGKKPKSLVRWMHFFTGNVSIKKALLEEVDMFDEKFVKWGSEDVDLGIRLFLKGIPFIHKSNIINYHMLHERSYKKRVQDGRETHDYLLKKYRKHLHVYLVLFAHKIYKIVFGNKKQPREV